MVMVSPTQLIGSCEALLPERATYPCDCVVVIIVSVEVPRAKTQTPPDLVVKPQPIDIIDFILWLVLRPRVVYQWEIKG